MRRFSGILLVVWAAVVLLAVVPSAHADGCYFPERAVATPPPIPAQRALLVWDEAAKRETLVIESSLDAKSQNLGWILPLPAEPDSIREASPGLLKTLDACFQPEVKHEFGLGAVVFIGSVPAGWLLYCCLGFIFWRRRFGLADVLLCVVWFMFLGLLMFASSSHGGGVTVACTTIDGVEVRESMIVGHYEVAVLKADSATALDKWLEQNGLASLPERGRSIAESYIRDGWRFAAVRLRLAEKGLQTPHPLAVTFPSKEAVYPMRLTALSGRPLWLDLFVVGPRRASAPVLKTWFASALVKTTTRELELHSSKPPVPVFAVLWANCVGHPDFMRLVPNSMDGTEGAGSMITRLSGEVSPGRMKNDFVIAWNDGPECRGSFYSARGAAELTLELVFGAVFLFVIVLAVLSVWEDWLAKPGGRRRYLNRVMLPGLGVICAAGLLFRLLLPVVHTSVAVPRYVMRSQGHELEMMAKDVVILSHCAGVAELRANFLEFVAELRIRNRPIEEASPGNYTVALSADGRPQITVYDEHGCPTVFAAPAKAAENKKSVGGAP